MKLLVALCLMIASAMSIAATLSKQCDTFSSTDKISSPLTIDEIEKQAMAELLAWRKERPEHPGALFGYANAGWLGLKSMFQPGDEIVRYSTNKLSWESRSGHRGFCLGKVRMHYQQIRNDAELRFHKIQAKLPFELQSQMPV